jgi:hypothetical protein
MKVRNLGMQLIESGLYVKAENPWNSGLLAKVAKELGFRVDPNSQVVRKSPPWSKARLYLAGMSPKQLEVIAKFIDAIATARERGVLGRKVEGKKLAPEVIREAFGPRKPRAFRSKAKPLEQLREEARKIREAIAVAPAAPIAERRLA